MNSAMISFVALLSLSARADAPSPRQEIQNGELAVSFQLKNGQVRDLSVRNERTQTALRLAEAGFGLNLISAPSPPTDEEEGKPFFLAQISPGPSSSLALSERDFRVVGAEREATAEGGEALRLSLVSGDYPIEVEDVYDLAPGSSVLHRRLRWRMRAGFGSRPWYLESATLLRSAVNQDQLASPGGFGQLVYLKTAFIGIEHPDAEVRFAQGTLNAHHDVFRALGESWQESEPLVIGVSASGRASDSFDDYLDTLRPHPVRPYALFNTWYDLRDLNEKDLLARARFFAHELPEKYGISLDSFVLDDGWDTGSEELWTPSDKAFPHGLEAIGDYLAGAHLALGLWLSPWGGYDEHQAVRARQAEKQGLETEQPYLCIGGDRYWTYLQKRVLTLQEKDKVRFWKLDGVLSSCNRADHGHPVGRASRPVLVNRFIELIRLIRQQTPEARIDVTVGSWPSPWWLKWADFVWMGGRDYHFSESSDPSKREKALTYRDATLFQKIVREGSLVPLHSLMTHGIILGKFNPIDDPSDSPGSAGGHMDQGCRDVFLSRRGALGALSLARARFRNSVGKPWPK